MSVGKKIIIAVIGAASIFFVITLSLYFYAKTDHAKNIVVNKINMAIPGTLSAENLEFSLFNSYVKLYGIQIKDQQNTICFKFKSLLLDLKIRSLFKKVLEISLVQVNSPEISLIMDTKGRINIVDALIKQDTKSPGKKVDINGNKGIPINVMIKKAQITGGKLNFNDPNNSIELRSLDMDILDVNFQDRQLSLNTRLKNSKITLKGKEILIKNLSLLFELKQGSKLDFDFDLESDLCILKAKGIASNIDRSPAIDLDIVATSRLEQFNLFLVNLFLEDKVNLEGLAKVTIAGKGPVNNPEATIKLDVIDLKVNDDLKGDEINLSASLVDRALSIDKGILNILGNNIRFNGMADLKDFFPKGFLHPAENPDGLTYDLSFDQKNGDFKHIEKWVKGYSGQFSSSGNITGKGIRPETLVASYNFNAVLKDFKQNKPGTDFLDFKIDIKGAIEKGICKIARFNAETGDTSIDGKGEFDISDKTLYADLNVNSQDLYPTTLALGIPPVKGSIDSNLSISGTITNPEIKAKVAGKNLMATGFSINDLQFAGSINPSGHAAIQRFIIQEQDLVLELKGSAHVFDKGFKLKDVIKANILVSGQNINPQQFLEPDGIKINPELLDSLINFNLTMGVGYTIGASMDKINFADIEFPIKSIHADIDLGKKQVSMVIEKIANLNASLDTENNQYNARIDFNHSNLTPLFKTLGINGIQTNIHGQIDAQGIIPLDLSENLAKGLYASQGHITMNADIKGSFKEPDFNALVNLSSLDYDLDQAGIKISNLNAGIMATPDKININALKTDLNKGHLTLNGNIDLKDYKIQGCKLVVSIDRLDIPLPSKTGVKESVFMEMFDSKFDINLEHDPMESQSAENLPGKKIPIKHIRADLNLNNLDLFVILDKTTDLKASFDPENLAYALELNFNNTSLTPIFKTANLDGVKGSINGHLSSKGKVNLALPEKVIQGLTQATGKLTCSADISGNLEKPDFDAAVTLSGLGYPIPQTGMSISNLNGKIKISKDILAIENIAANLEKGSLTLDGKIGLKDYRPVKGDIQLKGDNIALELPDTAKIEFGYDLLFSGTQEKSDLSGTLLMSKGEYYKDFTFDLTEAVSNKKRSTSTQVEKNSPAIPWIENISLNIDVDYKDPFTVDNNLAFILIEPNVNISGTLANPIITGRTKILEGTVIYLKKEFEIEKGIIDFVDPYKTDPDINLAAKTRVRDWTIKLEVSGKTDNLKFKLFSEPAEAQEDILSLLIAGKTTKELAGGDGGSYKNILADKASDIIGETMEESTPLDSFKVGYDDSGSEGGNVNVTMGKKLSKRLEVIYSMETEDKETIHTNAAEYKIMENILLKAFNDSKGDFGSEITFKLEFR